MRRIVCLLSIILGCSLLATKSISLWYCASTISIQAREEKALSKFAYRPIELVRLGDRVPGDNPAEPPDQRFGKDVDQKTWRQIDLKCKKRDGSIAEVSLLRPSSWLDSQNAKVGGILKIAVPECGIDGDAEVIAIGHCPSIYGGTGSVVTGTFRHRNASVINLHIKGLNQPIGTTPNHRFWSQAEKAFVRADKLQRDDAIIVFGEQNRIEKIQAIPELYNVYNIETYPNHVYHVSNIGILVHNSDPQTGTPLYHGTTTQETVTTNGISRAAANRIAGGADFVDPDGFSLTPNRALAQEYANNRAQLYGGDPVVIETTEEQLTARGVRTRSGTGMTDPGEVKIPWKEAGKIKPGDFTRVCP